ncbi:echinoidin-like [Eucyclogobius newberryi]|uniref:echinoidin-like n=1 Tax=Eucyclogobius newberryi TaxID=166745 RepID=UPI003B5C305C
MKTEDETSTSRHEGVHSGRRLKVTVLRVAVVLALVLIVAYVFDGVALFWSIAEKNKAPQPISAGPMTVLNPAATRLTLGCDEDWHLSGEKCYHFSKSQTSWSLSRTMCQEMVGDLVKVETREEQKFLFEKMKALKGRKSSEEMFWVGLTDSETEGEWMWMDGSQLNKSLAFWFVLGTANEPDNWTEYPAGEDCGRMGARAGASEFLCWFDVPCSMTSRFLCEGEPRRSPACQ